MNFTIDLKKSSLFKIDKSSNQNIGSNFNWSPCGNFIAYSCSLVQSFME